MFVHLQAVLLLVVDCGMLENLRDATARAEEDGSFRRCGLVLLVNIRTLNSSDRLTQLNLSLRSLWSSTTVMIKPWTGGIERAEDGTFPTSSIPYIADRIGQGIRRLPKRLRTQVRLLCIHKSGKVVSHGPPAPPSPNKQLILSTEVDSGRGGHSTGGHRPVATWPGQDGPPEETAVRGEEREDPKGRCPGQGTLQGVPQARQIPWRTWWRLWRTRQFKPWRTWAYHHQFWHSLPQVVMNGPFQINFFSPLVKIKFCCFC